MNGLHPLEPQTGPVRFRSPAMVVRPILGPAGVPFLGALVGLCLAGAPLGAVEVYDCEALATNQPLAGQDGWHVLPGQGEVDVVPGGLDENTTVVLRHRDTVPQNQPAFATRISDPRFNFVGFTGSETNAVIQFEATGEHVALLALGRDLDGDGHLTAAVGEIGPAFGVHDRRFRIQEANLGTVYDDNFNIGGGDANSGNDYYQLRLRLDFTANGGDGVGTLLFRNLTDGDTGFHSVPGVHNRPLGLLRLAPGARPALWNALWVQLQSNGNSVPVADNFIPNLNGIQLTGLAPTGGDLLLLQWRGGTGPYQVQRRPDLLTGTWVDVGGPTTALSAAVGAEGSAGFFRVTQP